MIALTRARAGANRLVVGRPVAIGLGRATERHAAPPKVAAGAPVVPCRWSQDGPRRRGPESRSELRDRLVALGEGGGDTVVARG